MKIIGIIPVLIISFLVGCEKRNGNNGNKNDDMTTQNHYNVVDYYFDIIDEGIYIIDAEHNFKMIINKNAYLDRRYGNLLIFRYNDRSMNDGRGSYFIYDYFSKMQMDIPLNLIETIKYIPENKIEITGINWYPEEDRTVTLEYSHNQSGRIIDYENECDESLCVYNSLFVDISYQIEIEIFNKLVYIDFANIRPQIDPPRLEIYFDDYHNVYYLCAWAINGILQ